jgi:hypothetical protein
MGTPKINATKVTPSAPIVLGTGSYGTRNFLSIPA